MKIKSKHISFIILLLIPILFASTAFATNINVVGNDFSAIEVAINSSKTRDIIILEPTTYTGKGKAISFNKATSPHNLTIKTSISNSRATLDARKLSNIAYISRNYNVNFINIDFINGNAGSGNGGAVSADGNISFINCKFTGNTAINGGAIYFNYGNHLIYNSTFTNNIAINNGGGIFYNQSIATIQHSSFTGNKGFKGSAIYNTNNVKGSLNIYTTTFANNLITPKISVSVPSFVNCTDIATVFATISGSNNVANAIFNIGNNLRINYTIPSQRDSLINQLISLNVNGRTFIARTDENGRGIFTFNTSGFPITNVPLRFTFSPSPSYSSVAIDSTLKITNKRVVQISYSKGKNWKKSTTTRFAKVVTPIYNNVKATVSDKYYVIINKQYTLSGKSTTLKTLKKQVGNHEKWVKIKSSNSKYRWHEQRKDTTSYKIGTKTTLTYYNGEVINKVVKKKVKFTTVKSRKLRNDWTEYLAETANCNPYSPKIQKLVKTIIKGKKSDVGKANAIWKWFVKNVKYDYDIYGGTRLGSEEMLKTKKGNCLDHAHLAVAMFRAAGLPAMYEYKARFDGKAHAWAKVYIKGKWLNADTVLKSGPMRGQSSWVKAKVLNDNPKNNFLLIDYNKHQNIKINGVWNAVYREIFYEGSSTPIIYYNL